MRKTGKIDPKLLEDINITNNKAFNRYIISILGGSTPPISNKYPWTYYVPTISDIKEKMMDFYMNEEGKEEGKEEIKEKYLHNLFTMIKQVYYITKLNVRNINMIRLADLKDSKEGFKKYKTILEKLVFTILKDDIIHGDYKSLENSYNQRPKFSIIYFLLGEDNYKSLIRHVLNDGKSFNDTKTIRTETLLKYILIAVQKLTPRNVDNYPHFCEAVVSLMTDVINANKNLVELSSITKLSTELSSTELSNRHNKLNNVFTFVKIRGDKENVTNTFEINKRYKVSLDKQSQIMYMGYDNIDLSINSPAPNNYLFGPFSHIFKQSDDNTVISKHPSMDPVLNKLKNGNSVCVIGYGENGSGKTSALIYADFEKEKNKRDGILINFCNMLKDSYGELEVSFVELEGNINEERDKDRQKYYLPTKFSSNGYKWGLTDDSKLESVNGVKLEKGMDIGKYIVTIMDNKRSIKATPNNPVNTRSHMIVFVKFNNFKKTHNVQKHNKSPYLIVCDFAGVENKFQCDKRDVLERFEKIKSHIKCANPLGASKDNCEQFETFYGVTETIEKSLKFNEDNNNPLFKATKLVVSNNKQILEKLYPDEKRREGFIPYANFLDSIALQIFNEQKYKVFLSSLSSLSSLSKKIDQNDPPLLSEVIAASKENIANDPKIKEWLEALKNIGNTTKGPKPIKLEDAVEDIKSYLQEIITKLEIEKNNNAVIETKKQDLIKSKEDIESSRVKMLSDICKERVREGLFINDSLSHLRNFVSYFINNIQTDGRGINPKFIDECAPLQCNPNFEDCFGNTSVLNENIDKSSVIVNEIRKKLCTSDKNCDYFKDITFCVFNVINLSKRDELPTPYIDISDLMTEMNRLESVKTMFVGKYSINDSSKSPLVHQKYLDEIKNSKILDEKYIGSLDSNDRKVILSSIENIESVQKKNELYSTINALKSLINIINNINSLSLIGTMEFTDMISKFGLNRTTCNYKYKRDINPSGNEVLDLNNTLTEYNKFISNLQDKYNERIQ